jgi:hypothetical protein
VFLLVLGHLRSMVRRHSRGTCRPHLLRHRARTRVTTALIPTFRSIPPKRPTYDQGYLPPEAVAETVRVRGRGGTILQPGIDLLERAEDFPADGPLLIMTDGLCDKLQVRRAHAFLIPAGHALPFVPKGPVFCID